MAEPNEPGASTPRRARARAIARTPACVAIVVAAVLSGVGWLYLLRGAGLLAAGPRLHGGLPLQQLAGDDAQPLLRMAAAWLPAGIVAGATLVRLGRARRPAAVAGTATFALLVLAGAASDAVANSEGLTGRLLPQLGRPGLWAAVALALAGAALAQRGHPAEGR